MSQGLLIALIVVAIATCGVAIYALVELVKTLRSVRSLSDELGETLPSLVEKADVAVDAFNAEMLRVDGIVGQFEEVADLVIHTANVVQEAAQVPATAVNAASERIREMWQRLKSGSRVGPSSSGHDR